MTIQYRPELQDKEPNCDIIADYQLYSRKWKLITKLSLSGAGIAQVSSLILIDKGLENEYLVTRQAFDKLAQRFTIANRVYFD